MSSSNRLIINCGASSITAAVISTQGGKLHVDKLASEDLHYDYSNDGAWLGAVGDALKALARTHKISGKATFIIPGNQVLTKSIKIPHVEEAKRAQIIAFEAQQSIPYPMHEIVWDSQVVGDDGVETEVLFIACKANTVDEFCTVVASVGLAVESISAATILDYNAIQFAYPSFDEDVLVINIGARSTNLLFRNADGFFVRNIALGGNTLTQSIADNLGKSFPQAEEIKHKFFGRDAAYSEDENGAKALKGCADAFMRRMGQEITRSIVNYRRQKNAAAPTRIMLNGRGALLKGIAEQLGATQKSEVEYFDPLQGVSLNGSITDDADVLRLEMSEIIGQACREMIADGAGVNLLPDEIQDEMRFAAQKPFLIAAAVCLALAPWPAFLAFKSQSNGYKAQAKMVRQEVEPLLVNQSEIERNAQAALAISESIQQVEGLVQSKNNWIQFFAGLQDSLAGAEDVWLDELEVDRGEVNGASSYTVTLKGQMLVRESADSIDREVLTRRIKGLQSSFEASEFIVSSKPPAIKWTKLNEGLNVLPFSINLSVDTAKPL